MMMWALVAILMAIVVETCEHLAFKKSSSSEEHKIVLRIIGIILYIVQLSAWLFALSVLPLSVASPLMGMTYVSVALVGRIYLKEKISLQRWLGILTIVIGVSMIAGVLA
jgi:undecaprenyl phosphate-alpha-L-ara4N flippase subunit ArnE